MFRFEISVCKWLKVWNLSHWIESTKRRWICFNSRQQAHTFIVVVFVQLMSWYALIYFFSFVFIYLFILRRLSYYKVWLLSGRVAEFLFWSSHPLAIKQFMHYLGFLLSLHLYVGFLFHFSSSKDRCLKICVDNLYFNDWIRRVRGLPKWGIEMLLCFEEVAVKERSNWEKMFQYNLKLTVPSYKSTLAKI